MVSEGDGYDMVMTRVPDGEMTAKKQLLPSPNDVPGTPLKTQHDNGKNKSPLEDVSICISY